MPWSISWSLESINRALFGGSSRCLSMTIDGAHILQCALAPGHQNVHRARSLPWEPERVWYASPLFAHRYTALECLARDAREREAWRDGDFEAIRTMAMACRTARRPA